MSKRLTLQEWHDSKTSTEDTVALKVASKALEQLQFSIPEVVKILDLPDQQLIASLKEPTTPERRARISLVLGIYSSLKKLFCQNENRIEWLQHQNSSLQGRSPRDLLLSGSTVALQKVHDYLLSNTV